MGQGEEGTEVAGPVTQVGKKSRTPRIVATAQRDSIQKRTVRHLNI